MLTKEPNLNILLLRLYRSMRHTAAIVYHSDKCVRLHCDSSAEYVRF